MKQSDNMTTDERMTEITNIFAIALIRLIEQQNNQVNYSQNERSYTRLPCHSKRSCVRKNNKERTDEN